jgi:hypothetical protein
MTKTATAPRLLTNQRRPNTDELVRPLPRVLADAMEGVPEQVEHANLADRYGELRTRREALAVELVKAQAADDADEREAIRTGARKKPGKAVKVGEQIAEVERDLEVLGAMMRDSATAVLTASLPYVRQAAADADAREQADLDRAADLLSAAATAFEASGVAAAESGWLARLAETGEAPPFTNTGQVGLVGAYRDVQGAITRLAEERERQRAYVEGRADELNEPNSVRVMDGSRLLAAPPSMTVWQMPGGGKERPAA